MTRLAVRFISANLRSLDTKRRPILLAAALLFCTSGPLHSQRAKSDTAHADHPGHPEQTLSSFSLVDSSGKEMPLSICKGKVVLIVNVASDSMFSDQLAGLSKLQDEFKDKGLMILAVPSNDFGKGEPGTDAEILKHYRDDMHATFTVTAKSAVSGKDELPLFTYLTGGKPDKPGEEVHWNYTKFIVSRDGKVLARFAPEVTPDDPDFQIAIQKALDGTLKPQEPKKDGKKEAGGGDDDDDGGI
jgi:glutathione peroxidase